MDRTAFTKYANAVTKVIHKSRRIASICFENPQSTKPYFAASIELSRNKVYWLIGSPLCPPEDYPNDIRDKVLTWTKERSLRASGMLGYMILADSDLSSPEETAALIIKEHRIASNKKKNRRHLVIFEAGRT